jgi:cardiolipin synthase A/B
MVTSLMGGDIKPALLSDLCGAEAGDEIYVLILFLSDRGVIDASSRAALGFVVLHANMVSFGEKKSGLPNQMVAAELIRRSDVRVRMGNTRDEACHMKQTLVRTRDRWIVHLGSANFDRRSLSNTTLEANVRVDAPADATVCKDLLAYLDAAVREPWSYATDGEPSRVTYRWYRSMDTTCIATTYPNQLP